MESAPTLSAPTSAVQILILAQAIIADPKNWTTGSFARTSNSNPVPAMNPRAIRWCGEGAIDKAVERSPFLTDAKCILDSCAQALYRMNSRKVNDTLGHRAMMAVYDFAIATFSKPFPKIPTA